MSFSGFVRSTFGRKRSESPPAGTGDSHRTNSFDIPGRFGSAFDNELTRRLKSIRQRHESQPAGTEDSRTTNRFETPVTVDSAFDDELGRGRNHRGRRSPAPSLSPQRVNYEVAFRSLYRQRSPPQRSERDYFEVGSRFRFEEPQQYTDMSQPANSGDWRWNRRATEDSRPVERGRTQAEPEPPTRRYADSIRRSRSPVRRRFFDREVDDTLSERLESVSFNQPRHTSRRFPKREVDDTLSERLESVSFEEPRRYFSRSYRRSRSPVRSVTGRRSSRMEVEESLSERLGSVSIRERGKHVSKSYRRSERD